MVASCGRKASRLNEILLNKIEAGMVEAESGFSFCR